MELQHLVLHQPHIGAPVRRQVNLLGAESSRNGVQAWVQTRGMRPIVLLADSPSNKGVSATNGVESYAEAVCRATRPLPYALTDFDWIELDSEGCFDCVIFTGDVASFAPLCEENYPSRSRAAFLARMARIAPDTVPQWKMALANLYARGDVDE